MVCGTIYGHIIGEICQKNMMMYGLFLYLREELPFRLYQVLAHVKICDILKKIRKKSFFIGWE